MKQLVQYSIINFPPVTRFKYIDNASELKFRNTEVRLKSCRATLHSVTAKHDEDPDFGMDLSHWVVCGLEGEIDAQENKARWPGLILGWIPPEKRQGDLVAFKFHFTFEDGSSVSHESRIVYRLNLQQPTKENMRALQAFRDLALKSKSKQTNRVIQQSCGLQSTKFK